jgi:hypothetical protein
MSQAQLEKVTAQAVIQAALIAISTRIVGSAFRCLETLNPNYQQSQVISNPRTVCIRELSTIAMAFGFSLITSAAILPRAKMWGWSHFKVQFITSVIGTFLAEGIGRLIAYRKSGLKTKAVPMPVIRMPSNQPHFQIPSLPLQAPIMQVQNPPRFSYPAAAWRYTPYAYSSSKLSV